NTCGDGLTWDLTDGVLTITYDGEGTGVMNDYTTGTAPWYENRADITSIVIPSGVTSIGDYAFEGCNNASLTSVDIPSSVTSVGKYAFVGCSNLATATFGAASLTEYGAHAFDYCNASLTIWVPNSAAVTAFIEGDEGVWHIHRIITRVCGDGLTWDLADGVLTISKTGEGTGAMYDYTSDTTPWYADRDDITSVTIGSGVTSIGNYAFYRFTNESLTSIDIPSTVTSIGREAFAEISNLTSLTIPDNVLTLGYAAFCGCHKLETVHIGSGVTTLPKLAFKNLTSLTQITIPNTVTSLSDYVFNGCVKLATVIFESGSTISSIPEGAFDGCTALTSFDIPEGVTSIGDQAFSSCEALTYIDIPEGVTSIGMAAFAGCEALTSIDIPEGVTSIGMMAFAGCAFSSIVLPASITEIGAVAFSQCPNLTSVTIWNTSAPTLAKDKLTGDNGVFALSDKLSAIYVPTAAAKTAYEGADAAKNWSDYSSLLKVMSNTLTANLANGSYWCTYYNSHSNAQVDEHTKVYTVTVDGTRAKLYEIADRNIKAGQGVVLNSTQETIELTYNSTETTGDFSANELKGVDVATPCAANYYYALGYIAESGLGMYKYSGTTLAANKAYMEEGVADIKGFAFSFDDVATGVDDVRGKEEAGRSEYFDLSGRRVSKPTKGMYIVNGKKRFLK
nr:leucine-rich repeat domain-containing protein [Bacteroidaceae bacterium]